MQEGKLRGGGGTLLAWLERQAAGSFFFACCGGGVHFSYAAGPKPRGLTLLTPSQVKPYTSTTASFALCCLIAFWRREFSSSGGTPPQKLKRSAWLRVVVWSGLSPRAFANFADHMFCAGCPCLASRLPLAFFRKAMDPHVVRPKPIITTSTSELLRRSSQGLQAPTHAFPFPQLTRPFFPCIPPRHAQPKPFTSFVVARLRWHLRPPLSRYVLSKGKGGNGRQRRERRAPFGTLRCGLLEPWR